MYIHKYIYIYIHIFRTHAQPAPSPTTGRHAAQKGMETAESAGEYAGVWGEANHALTQNLYCNIQGYSNKTNRQTGPPPHAEFVMT